MKTLSGLPCAEAVGVEKQPTTANNVSNVRSSFGEREMVMHHSLLRGGWSSARV
jgi:hypothetical protein